MLLAQDSHQSIQHNVQQQSSIKTYLTNSTIIFFIGLIYDLSNGLADYTDTNKSKILSPRSVYFSSNQRRDYSTKASSESKMKIGESRQIKWNRNIEVINVTTNEKIIFTTIRQATSKLKISNKTIVKYTLNKKL